KLACVMAFPEDAEMHARKQKLNALETAISSRGGFLMGDLTRGGRPATHEELRRLGGVQSGGVPVGVERCGGCGEWRGECLDTVPTPEPRIVTVHCVCENWNRCAWCGQPLYKRRLNANYLDP